MMLAAWAVARRIFGAVTLDPLMPANRALSGAFG